MFVLFYVAIRIDPKQLWMNTQSWNLALLMHKHDCEKRGKMFQKCSEHPDFRMGILLQSFCCCFFFSVNKILVSQMKANKYIFLGANRWCICLSAGKTFCDVIIKGTCHNFILNYRDAIKTHSVCYRLPVINMRNHSLYHI